MRNPRSGFRKIFFRNVPLEAGVDSPGLTMLGSERLQDGPGATLGAQHS